jgi:hypothetical protein
MSSGGGHGGHGGGLFELPGLHELHEVLESSNEHGGFIVPAGLLFAVYAIAVGFFAASAPVQSALNWDMLLLLGPVWLPIVLGRFAFYRFMNMRQMNFNYNNPFVLLEMRIPREISKSPKAMETVFASFNIGPGAGTWLKQYWWGRTRPWWSFELVSIEGEVHFYICTRQNMRRATETYMYAQFPEIELIEAVDYARLRDPINEPYAMFACEYGYGKSDAYPIRTYVDLGLDKPGIKPEEQVDPFAQVLELMGSLGPGEQLWTQMIIRLSKTEKYRGELGPSGKKKSIRDVGREEIEKLRKSTVNVRKQVDAEGNVQELEGFPNPNEFQKELIGAIERHMDKPAFDVGIRSIYSARADKYMGTMNAFTANIFKVFISEQFNQLKPLSLWSEKFNDFPWEDIGGHRQRAEMHEVLEAYRARSYFHPPYRGPWMIMSSEELATIYHIPSSTVQTPSLPRIGSTTSAPPPNLPQ